MRYSPSHNGFYPESTRYPQLPGDIIDIPDELYRQLLIGQNEGKAITPNGTDAPYLSEPVPQERAEADRSRLTSAANAYMSERQWPGKAAIGRLTSEELAQYNLWLDYLDALYAVDTSAAPDVEWPTPPER